MALAAGTRLGPYEILSPLGAGGMGEVYRARDTNLKREVAIKVLPEALAGDAGRMLRFQREAELLASLNHSNIAHIYGVEERALVMELVEGETLPAGLPIDTALGYARQIAEALEYAHERGVIHRDLKPANIKVTVDGVVKLLDFGLAKAIESPAAAADDPSNSPTLTLGVSRVGVILGTAAYMSPEQASGKTADRRADIWSFGAVLYEMLSGKRAFDGESASDTLASVLKLDPDWNALPKETPSSIAKLVRRCLTKDRKQRLQAVGEARILLENFEDAEVEREVLAGSPSSAARHRSWLWPSVAAFLLVALMPVNILHLREEPPPEPALMRFQIHPGDQVTIGNNMSLSPDGRKIVFQGTDADGTARLWLHALDSLDTRSLAGTEGVANGAPFWSPDSRFIVFGARGKLKKIAASGGPAQILCDSSFNPGGGFWTRDGTIVFGGNPNLLRVSASGGPVTPVTALVPGEVHAVPSLLPDGRHFIYARAFGPAEKSGIFLGSLDGKPDAQDSKRLLPDQSTGPIYVPGSSKETGYVLFIRENTLMAQPFDNSRMNVTGEPVAVAEQVTNVNSHYWATSSGVLIYQAAGRQNRELTWYDRQGKVLGKAGRDQGYASVSLSPDGDRLAVGVGQGGLFDIYVVEPARNTSTQFTSGQGRNDLPVWSPEGESIVYSSERDGRLNLFRKASNGAGAEEALLKSTSNQYVGDWSRDGKFLIYSELDSQRRNHLWVVQLAGERKPVKFLETKFGESAAQFSPDGRWVAYQSDESGRFEVYVRPFPDSESGKWMVSQGGGYQPRWRRDGKELLYFSGNGTLMASEVTAPAVSAARPAFKTSAPVALFQAPILGKGVTQSEHRWDIGPDGKKFIIITVPEQTAAAPITAVLNWQAGLKK